MTPKTNLRSQLMSKWKILITDGLSNQGQELLRAAALVDDRNGISPQELLECIPEYDALVVRSRSKVNSHLLENAKRLKVIGRAGVGVDNIDLEAARARGITVLNTPTSTSIAVAEHTLALMLSLSRSIPKADASMKSGEWLKKELPGVELFQKTLGVIGMGHIGGGVARRASAFGMSVIAYDPLINADEIRQRGAEPVSLDDLYANSDFISVHVPLTEETRGMIGAQAIEMMKWGVRLICDARGGVIDEEALLPALQSGQVAGAALDVFSLEPPGKTELVLHPHVVATPHIGAQTAEAQVRAATDIATEILAALNGEKLRWKIV
jgi:D-3-phosphoglycerate dehydrogenase / 2-oxoglutarate reductase